MPTFYHTDEGVIRQLSPQWAAEPCPQCYSLSVHFFANDAYEWESCKRCDYQTEAQLKEE